MNAPDRIDLSTGTLELPVFLPDATRGVVRGLDATDLARCGVRAVMMNVFHLQRTPGLGTVKTLGGLHAMSGWAGPIFTDSGGFQAYSLIRENPSRGSISDHGLSWRPQGGQKFTLSPEKSVQTQLSMGADLVVCLDECTHADACRNDQETAVTRTLSWAKKGRQAYERWLADRNPENRPLLFAVVQGGAHEDLRRRCAQGLLEIGFDGFGFGGWPYDSRGNLLTHMLDVVRDCIPGEFPLHALGVGSPAAIAACTRAGYGLFDSALPTRDARHGRLYVPEFQPGEKGFHLYLKDDVQRRNAGPVSLHCSCLTCRTVSVGYLRHLWEIRDPLYVRLATLHNLTCINDWVGALERSRHDDPA